MAFDLRKRFECRAVEGLSMRRRAMRFFLGMVSSFWFVVNGVQPLLHPCHVANAG
jgi:hypothetical protein